jgi:hypothetical protein
MLDGKSKLWVTTLNHRVKQRQVASDSFVPIPGDILEITRDLEVVILDYKTRGEQNRFMPPTSRLLTRDDLWEVNIPAGTEVLVQDVVREPVLYAEKVWARIARPPVKSAP